MFADPSIFYANQAQGDGTFKAIATLFAEEGIDNLSPAPENNELLGMERILSHWMNLDQREPILKIVCPKALQDIAKPNCGIVNGGCPRQSSAGLSQVSGADSTGTKPKDGPHAGCQSCETFG
jgi:hypothetical protein